MCLRLFCLVGVTSALVACHSDGATHTASADSRTGDWKLVCLGDGYTAGEGLQASQRAYPALMAVHLAGRYDTIRVVNAGLAGESLRGAAERLPWLLQQRLDALLLALGHTELEQGVGLATWQADWQFLLKELRKIDPGLKVYVTVLSPLALPAGYASTLEEIAHEHHATYLTLPLSEWAEDSACWIEKDGVKRSSARGQEWLAKRLAQQLK